MGKKTKKKKQGNQRGGKKGGTASSASSVSQQSKKKSTDFQTLYTLYKYSTQAVFDWGRSTYKEQKGGGSRGDKKLKSILAAGGSGGTQMSLVLLLQCLGTLAEMGLTMPESILAHLRRAIRYRKRAGEYYKAAADPQDYDRHQWLITQFERLEMRFVQNGDTGENENEEGDKSTKEETLAGFHLLLSDSEEEEEEEEEGKTGSQSPTRRGPTPRPTAEELEAEERVFAISLVLTQIAEARTDLQQVWNEWATNQLQTVNTVDEDDKPANLLAAMACTDYTVTALHKLVQQASIEYTTLSASLDDLPAIAKSILNHPEAPVDLTVGECVTLRNLRNRLDLNGRHGKIKGASKQDDHRFAVQLFSIEDNDDAASKAAKKKTSPIVLSIAPENLVRSDNPYLRMAQIVQALQSFSFESCPEPPNRMYLAPPAVQVERASTLLMAKASDFGSALKSGDYARFMQLTIQYALPIWVAFARFFPNSGAADVVFVSYVREFAETKRVKFHLALAIMVMVDSAFAAAATAANNASSSVLESTEQARDLYVKVLKQTYNGDYKRAIELFDKKGIRSDAFYSHYEFSRQYQTTFSAMSSFFPWFSGEMLQSGLRMHLVCGSGLPYQFCQEYTTLLHLYWMLRTQGYLGCLPEIESSLIRMYRQQVFFRGGLPRRGSEGYLKSWQLATGGVNLQGARLLGGREKTRRAAPHRGTQLDMRGLHVTEISQLQDILQWKTMPILDRAAAYKQIQEIAKDEYHSVYTAPLMSTCHKLSYFGDFIAQKYIATARSGGDRMVQDFSSLTQALCDLNIVCFWALSLADDRALDAREKETGLFLLAGSFKQAFKEEMTRPGAAEEPSMDFSPNEHSVDPSLWGEEGALRPAYTPV
jgi:hypothetical protein